MADAYVVVFREDVYVIGGVRAEDSESSRFSRHALNGEEGKKRRAVLGEFFVRG